MDYLDIQIFRSLGLLSFGEDTCDISRLNPWVIARKLGANGRTVKLRLNKMQECGFINYFQIYPNFRFLGLNGAGYGFDIGDVRKKDKVIENCSLADGVTEVHNFIGGRVCIDFAYRDSKDEERRLELLRRLTNCDSPVKVYDRVMPPLVDNSLSSTDWMIIKALRYNALKPQSVLANELGRTVKTVRRRFERMAKNNSIAILPIINPARLPNALTYVIQVYPSHDEWKSVMESVAKIFEQSCLLTRTYPPKWAALYLTAKTLAETEDNLIKVSQIKGVKDASILILKEIRDYSRWLDSTIESKIKEAGNSYSLD